MRQVERVRNTRVGRQLFRAQVELIVIRDRFAFGDVKNCMLVGRFRLHAVNVAVVIGSREQFDRRVCSTRQRIHIKLIHLLSQHHAFASSQRFAPLVGSEVQGIKVGFRQGMLLECAQHLLTRFLMLKPVREVFVLKVAQDAFAVEKHAGVIPGHGFDRRLIERLVVGDVGAACIPRCKRAVVFDIDLFDAAKTAKLALWPIKVAVVIAVGGGEGSVAPLVVYRHLLHTMHGEGQLGDPGLTRLACPAGRTWSKARTATVVSAPRLLTVFTQQVRFLPTHQVKVAQRAARITRQRRRPDQAGGAIAQQIQRLHIGDLIDVQGSV